MQDGLGSVRALVDDASVVQSAMAYDPYGNPMGAYGAGFGFTGEQTDANGSVFLRARYYEPSLGVFSALDPFEGKSCTPMSLNGYGYVHGNPINMVDPSGNVPTRDTVNEDLARYSCRCGWIDFNHLSGGFSKSKFLKNALNSPIPWDELGENFLRGRFINLHRTADYVLPVNYLAFVPEHEALTNPQTIALGIYKAFETKFEKRQAIYNLADSDFQRASGFSFEDFPSDLIGFYLGLLDESEAESIGNRPNGWEKVSEYTSCDLMSKDDSLHMFQEYRDADAFVVRFGKWKNWYKKDRPASTTLPPNHVCSNETWPEELNLPSVEKSGDTSIGALIAGYIPQNGFWKVRRPLQAIG